jgi:hypothetical protein
VAIRVDKVVPGNTVDHQHLIEDVDDLDTTYLKLDGSNGPVTGDLDVSGELKENNRPVIRYNFMMGGR